MSGTGFKGMRRSGKTGFGQAAGSANVNGMDRTDAIEKLKGYADAIKALGGTSLYLFGSTSRDEARPDSDLDLFMDYDSDGSFNAFDLVEAKRMLEAGLGVDVDLTTRDGLHPLISKRIEADAIRIF